MTNNKKTTLQPRHFQYLIPKILALCLVVFSVIYYFSIEWEEKEIDLGPTSKAKRNLFLAAQQFLDTQNIENTAVKGLTGLDELRFADEPIATDDTLILANSYQSLTQKQIDVLWQWVYDGGQLIVMVENPYFGGNVSVEDPLLERLGLHWDDDYQHNYNNDEEPLEDLNEKIPDQAPDNTIEGPDEEPEINIEDLQSLVMNDTDFCDADHKYQAVEFPISTNEPNILIEFGYRSYFSTIATTNNSAAEMTTLAQIDDRILLAQFDLGSGTIYTLPSAVTLQNRIIHCHDHAYFLWRLTQDTNKVWFVTNIDTPSFWHYIWKLSWAGCVALSMALAFWVWLFATRFGPFFTTKNNNRRSFLEHLTATAQFVIRHHGSSQAIESLRVDILQKITLRHPSFEKLSKPGKIEKIITMTDMPAADIELALFSKLPVTDNTFLDIVKRLQHLRNCL